VIPGIGFLSEKNRPINALKKPTNVPSCCFQGLQQQYYSGGSKSLGLRKYRVLLVASAVLFGLVWLLVVEYFVARRKDEQQQCDACGKTGTNSDPGWKDGHGDWDGFEYHEWASRCPLWNS
jgi:hypothetical protein